MPRSDAVLCGMQCAHSPLRLGQGERREHATPGRNSLRDIIAYVEIILLLSTLNSVLVSFFIFVALLGFLSASLINLHFFLSFSLL